MAVQRFRRGFETANRVRNVISLGLAAAIIAAWFVMGLAAALRERLTARIAFWLLPDDQPITYRLAIGVAWLAAAIAPKCQRRPMIRLSQSLTMNIGHAGETLGYGSGLSCVGPFPITWSKNLIVRIQENVLPFLESRGVDYAATFRVLGPLEKSLWSRPEELLAELEADLRYATPVNQPLSMSLPVFAESIQLRVQCCGIALLAVVLATIALGRSTRPVALIEAHVYELRYPPAGVPAYVRSAAAIAVLTGQLSVANAAKHWRVGQHTIRCWVRTANRDAGRTQPEVPAGRFQAAEVALKIKSPERVST